MPRCEGTMFEDRAPGLMRERLYEASVHIDKFPSCHLCGIVLQEASLEPACRYTVSDVRPICFPLFLMVLAEL